MKYRDVGVKRYFHPGMILEMLTWGGLGWKEDFVQEKPMKNGIGEIKAKALKIILRACIGRNAI